MTRDTAAPFSDSGPGRARVGRRFAPAALVIVALAPVLPGGCSLLDRPPEILDELSIGGDARCGACDGPDTSPNCGACESIRTLAIRRVDETWPTHPEIESMTFHMESWYPGPSGEKMLHARSGSLVVALVTFADGTRHATSVYCGVGGCR